MNIRLYKHSDYEIIKGWWLQINESPPSIEMLPEDSTFVLTNENNKPIACVNAYLTNSKEVSFVENLIKDSNSDVKKEDIQKLINYIFNYIKEQGYKRTLCFSYRDKLKKRYQEFGFIKTLDNVSTFCKEL